MMGRLSHDQEQFFYSFRLDEAVPEDHAVREIAAVLDLGLESLLFAVLACLGFSRENHPSVFRDFCNTIGGKADIGRSAARRKQC